jgi:hypothetical protein
MKSTAVPLALFCSQPAELKNVHDFAENLAVSDPHHVHDIEAGGASQHGLLHTFSGGYRDKGGAAESFNCVNLQLTSDDIDHLEVDIRATSLRRTDGFFFGVSDGSEIEDDLQFVAKAREALAAELTVFYTSWW